MANLMKPLALSVLFLLCLDRTSGTDATLTLETYSEDEDTDYTDDQSDVCNDSHLVTKWISTLNDKLIENSSSIQDEGSGSEWEEKGLEEDAGGSGNSENGIEEDAGESGNSENGSGDLEEGTQGNKRGRNRRRKGRRKRNKPLLLFSLKGNRARRKQFKIFPEKQYQLRLRSRHTSHMEVFVTIQQKANVTTCGLGSVMEKVDNFSNAISDSTTAEMSKPSNLTDHCSLKTEGRILKGGSLVIKYRTPKCGCFVISVYFAYQKGNETVIEKPKSNLRKWKLNLSRKFCLTTENDDAAMKPKRPKGKIVVKKVWKRKRKMNSKEKLNKKGNKRLKKFGRQRRKRRRNPSRSRRAAMTRSLSSGNIIPELQSYYEESANEDAELVQKNIYDIEIVDTSSVSGSGGRDYRGHGYGGSFDPQYYDVDRDAVEENFDYELNVDNNNFDSNESGESDENGVETGESNEIVNHEEFSGYYEYESDESDENVERHEYESGESGEYISGKSYEDKSDESDESKESKEYHFNESNESGESKEYDYSESDESGESKEYYYNESDESGERNESEENERKFTKRGKEIYCKKCESSNKDKKNKTRENDIGKTEEGTENSKKDEKVEKEKKSHNKGEEDKHKNNEEEQININTNSESEKSNCKDSKESDESESREEEENKEDDYDYLYEEHELFGLGGNFIPSPEFEIEEGEAGSGKEEIWEGEKPIKAENKKRNYPSLYNYYAFHPTQRKTPKGRWFMGGRHAPNGKQNGDSDEDSSEEDDLGSNGRHGRKRNRKVNHGSRRLRKRNRNGRRHGHLSRRRMRVPAPERIRQRARRVDGYHGIPFRMRMRSRMREEMPKGLIMCCQRGVVQRLMNVGKTNLKEICDRENYPQRHSRRNGPFDQMCKKEFSRCCKEWHPSLD